MRLSYVDMCALHDRMLGSIDDVATYVEEWDELVSFAGWSWSEVLSEIDRRWSIKTQRTVLPSC